MKKIMLAGLVIFAISLACYFYIRHAPTTTQMSAATTDNTSDATIVDEVSRQDIPADIQQKLDYAQFQDQTREFFDHEKNLSQHERQQRGDSIDKQAQQFQQEGFLSANEVLVLKLAVMKLTLSETDFAQRGEALIKQYKNDYDVAYEEWLKTPDPQFETYKQQESEIVKRVMAMTSFPEGLSRDEYLRRELERARIAAYQQP